MLPARQSEALARVEDLLAGAAVLDEAGFPNAWELARFAVSRRRKPLRLDGDLVLFGTERSCMWETALMDDPLAVTEALTLLGVAIPVTMTPELRQLFGTSRQPIPRRLNGRR